MRFFTTFATFAVTFATCNAAIGQDTYQNRGVRVQVPFGAPSSSHNSCDRPPRTTTVTEVVDGVTVTVPAGGHPLSWLSQETPAASDDEPVTMTTTTHHTRFMYEVVATKTMILPWAVQTSNAGQKEDNCDRTACESCSLFYGCDNGEPACIHCKHAAFCKDCEPYDERPIIYERPVIDKEGFKSGRTCSLGPDQSIDCNALNDPKYRRVNVFEWEH